MNGVTIANNDELRGGSNGHADLGGKPADSVRKAFGVSVPHPNCVAMVGF